MNERRRGLLYTAGGVLALTPDAVLIKLAGLPASGIFFWRGMLVALVLLAGFAAVRRGGTLAGLLAVGRPGIASALCYAVGTGCFVAANTLTVAANVLVIVATAPLFSAVFAQLLLGERTAPRTWAASLVAIAGVALVAGEQVALDAGLGELLALGCAILVSLNFVIIRGARNVSMIPATVLGSFMVGCAGVFFLELPPDDTGWAATLLAGLVFIPLAYAGLTAGPRWLPSAEVGLLMLLETVIGPVWVWLAIGEQPTRLGLVGGAVILGALAVNTWLGERRAPRAAKIAPEV